MNYGLMNLMRSIKRRRLIDKKCMKKHSDNKHLALKAGIGYTIGSLLIKGFSMLTAPIFNRLMGMGDVGAYFNFTSWESIVAVVVTLNLYSTINVAKVDHDKSMSEYVSSIVALGTIITALFYIVVCFFIDDITKYTGIPHYAIHLMFICLLFAPAVDIYINQLKVEFDYMKTIIISFISFSIPTIGGIALCLSLQDKLKARIYGTYVLKIAIFLSIFIFLIKKGKRIKFQYWKYALPIALPLVIHYLATNVLHSADRVMITKMCGTEDNAIYSVGYTSGQIVNVLRNSIEGAWTPWVYLKIKNGEYSSIKKYGRYYIAFFMLICMCFGLFAPEIVLFMGGKAYKNSIYVIPPVIMAYAFSAIYGLYAGIELYYKKQNVFVYITTFTAILNVVLNKLLIPLHGYIAAAYTTLVCLAISCLLHFLNTKKLKKDGLYDNFFNAIVLAGMLIFSFVLSISYRLMWVRVLVGVVIGVCVCLCIINKAKLKNIFKDILENKND